MKQELIVQIPLLQQAPQRELQAQARLGDMQAIIILRPKATDEMSEHQCQGGPPRAGQEQR